MKKFVSMIMALAMVCALSVTAFAVEDVVEDSLESKTANVTATYSSDKDTEPATVYHVVITWGVTAGEYKDAGVTYTWDSDILKYKATPNEGGVSKDAVVKVTVSNRSNATVNAEISYASATDINSTDTWTSNKTATLGSAAANISDYKDVTTEGKAQDYTFEGSVNVAKASLSKLADNNNIAGTVTVALTAG